MKDSVRFISKNKFKIQETRRLLRKAAFRPVPVRKNIDEIQTKDERALVTDKAIKAFKIIGKPLFVEHTGLYLETLGGLPGGLTQLFWDTLKADRFATLFGGSKVTAQTLICYCDGRRFHYFDGSVEGEISRIPMGNRNFQWDCVFIPKGYKKTFAQLGPTKDKISMRRVALDRLITFLK